MNKKRCTRIPSLRHCNGRGFVELNGQRVYLGPWEAKATKRKYERVIAEWLSHGKRLPIPKNEFTVIELVDRYWEHSKEYYGNKASTLTAVKQALRPLKELYGDEYCITFGPNSLRTLREVWIDRDLSRSTINRYTTTVKRAFKWGVSHELIPVEVFQALDTVEGIKTGRTRVRDGRIVKPVPQSHIDAIESYVSRQVWALIQLQLLTGARSGEILRLKPIDFNTSSNPWTVVLEEHKTSYKGKRRTLYFGPKAQATIKEFWSDRPINRCLFSPLEAEQERHEQSPTHRRPTQQPNTKKTARVVGECYDSGTYRRAIERACTKAGVPTWTPHQLRHNAATRFRQLYGAEAARVMLGHFALNTTEIYAEADEELAKKIGCEIG